MHSSPTIAILGGTLNAGNRGVSALGLATIAQLHRHAPHVKMIVQNSTLRGSRERILVDGEIDRFFVEPIFLHGSKRLRDRCGTRLLSAAGTLAATLPSSLGNRICGISPSLVKLRQADWILDISAGDSFSDIYGWKVFEDQVAIKRLGLRLGVPLTLLPQTYGPFISTRARRIALDVIRQCALVATRELEGLEELDVLAGKPLPPSQFVQCPDVAFSLDAIPTDLENEPWVRNHRAESFIGLNISGLLFYGVRDFGLRLSYSELVRRSIEWAINEAKCNVLLVPHVWPHQRKTSEGPDISDLKACLQILQELGPKYGDKLGMLNGEYNSAEIKWLIGHCNFFIGARMHACIGALSRCVPTATLAYSKKASGVMDLARISGTVVDARGVSVEECLHQIKAIYDNRESMRTTLNITMPHVLRNIDKFFASLASSL